MMPKTFCSSAPSAFTLWLESATNFRLVVKFSSGSRSYRTEGIDSIAPAQGLLNKLVRHPGAALQLPPDHVPHALCRLHTQRRQYRLMGIAVGQEVQPTSHQRRPYVIHQGGGLHPPAGVGRRQIPPDLRQIAEIPIVPAGLERRLQPL